MEIKITCTEGEQIQFKRNLKINADDTGIVYTQPLLNKPDDMTCGEYIVSLIEWDIKEEK